MYYYCYSIKKGLFEQEMEYAKFLNAYLFYDEEKDKFYDKYNNEVNINNRLIFPRTGALEAKNLIEAITKHNGNSLITIEEYEKTLNWPNYIKTSRKNILISGKKIIENPQYIIDIFGNNQIFFKTKFKNYSQIINIKDLLDQNSALIKTITIHQDEDFIISDVVEIIEDTHGPREYRAFVVNNEIINISRVNDYLLEQIDTNIINKLYEIVYNLQKSTFPNSYVIDIFEYKNTKGEIQIDILECNPIIASGTYLYNSVFEKKDLEHKCPSISIPEEKIITRNTKEYSYEASNSLTPSIYYNLPGGFAKDLTSFHIFGTKSTEDMYFHIDAPGFNLLSLSSILENIIEDEEDLIDDIDDEDIKRLTRKKIK